MSEVTAVGMDVVTEKSGHQVTGMAVSVCITPAAPSPLPLPYPTTGNVAEGIIDEPLRTKINGAKHATVGSCIKVCHGNEPGTLKEVLSLNTGGPSFLLMGNMLTYFDLFFRIARLRCFMRSTIIWTIGPTTKLQGRRRTMTSSTAEVLAGGASDGFERRSARPHDSM